MTHLAFVIAKKGKNAETATDPNDFVFHSDYNTFKIIATGTKEVTLIASTNNQSFTQAHNQRFIPLIAGFAKESTLDQVFLPNGGNVNFYGVKAGYDISGAIFNYISANITNITFNFSNTSASNKTVTIRYYVLEKVN